MSEQAIVDRIISDAEKEAQAIIAEAEKRAAATVASANERAERRLKGEKQSADRKAESILEGKAATARLDSAKILLAEKRALIDEVYARALKNLSDISKTEALRLFEKLIAEFAEEGDEIVFAENFRYAQDAAKLAIIKDKKLTVSSQKADIDGGFLLVGKSSDKNLSYSALLSADREVNQADIAAKIFSV